MIRDSIWTEDRVEARDTIAGLGIMICAMLMTFQAFAQPTTTDPQGGNAVPPTAVAPPPEPSFQPGFIDAFGRFVGDSASKLNSTLSSQFNAARDTLGDLGNQTGDAAKTVAKTAVGAAKDTAGSIVGLPSARFVDGRERCAVAPNGGADCRAAADTVCRGKGFASGKILDTRSEQKCPARVWLSGHLPADGECPHETFVTRAVCQ